jgi:hypothetical protein
LHVKEHDQNRQVDDRLVEMEQKKRWFQVTQKQKTNHLRGREGRYSSIDSHSAPLWPRAFLFLQGIADREGSLAQGRFR